MALKCKHCGIKDIVKSEYTFVKIKSGYSHISCHKNYLMTRKRNPMSEEEAQKEIDVLYGDVLDMKLENMDKDRFYSNINSKYDISVFPKFFFVKMAEITSGKFRGMTKPISYRELDEMFSMMWNYLVKTRMMMESKGSKFKDDLGKLNYDLIVIINNYDKYLKHKNKQAKLENSKERVEKEIVERKSLNIVKRNKSVKKSNVDDILDDIL